MREKHGRPTRRPYGAGEDDKVPSAKPRGICKGSAGRCRWRHRLPIVCSGCTARQKSRRTIRKSTHTDASAHQRNCNHDSMNDGYQAESRQDPRTPAKSGSSPDNATSTGARATTNRRALQRPKKLEEKHAVLRKNGARRHTTTCAQAVPQRRRQRVNELGHASCNSPAEQLATTAQSPTRTSATTHRPVRPHTHPCTHGPQPRPVLDKVCVQLWTLLGGTGAISMLCAAQMRET